MLPATQARQYQGEGDEKRCSDVEVGSLKPDDIAIGKRELDGNTIDDRTGYTANENDEDKTRAQQGFTDDDRRKADHDGADAGGHVCKTICLGE